jgi:alkylmercury lyase
LEGTAVATPTQQLTTHLTAALDAADARPWLWRPLLRLLAKGRPVTTDQLAHTTGASADEIRQVLAAMPDTEYDEQGRISGSGLTQRPTPHLIKLNGHHLYSRCALDSLVLPVVLGVSAEVQSHCRTTGTPIRFTITPTAVRCAEPATPVLSIVEPDDAAPVDASSYDNVHFFASREATHGLPAIPVCAWSGCWGSVR